MNRYKVELLRLRYEMTEVVVEAEDASLAERIALEMTAEEGQLEWKLAPLGHSALVFGVRKENT